MTRVPVGRHRRQRSWPAHPEQRGFRSARRAERAIAEARNLIRGMRTAPLDDLGLRGAIEDLVEQCEIAGTEVGVAFAGDIDPQAATGHRGAAATRDGTNPDVARSIQRPR